MSTNWSGIPSEADLKKCRAEFNQFVIRVLDKDEKEEAMTLIIEALFRTRDDPITSALQFDVVSTEYLIRWIRLHLNQDIVYGCFLKDNTYFSLFKKQNSMKIKLVAVDVLYVRNRLDIFPELSKDSGEPFVNLMKYIKRIEKHIWSKGQQKINNILTSFGIFASEQYKNNKRISNEMIKNRKQLAQGLRIEVLGAACIGKTTKQAQTEALTYEVLHIFQSEDSKELGLENISEKDTKTIFPIVIMGHKLKSLKRKSDAEIRDESRQKKLKVKKEKL